MQNFYFALECAKNKNQDWLKNEKSFISLFIGNKLFREFFERFWLV
ncbi:hypothetical protein HPNQ4044_1264 [Helicobacter pylori NQ4044]|uniref:Uncharacterized protein n=1 Tax=Helicobacter pylori NQ4044 TaxID=992028 RepID=J0JBB6_HELPX|nr:hypothetical protein HPNQ4044_1264 [Helicobacter pylori NQ4044]